MDLDQIMTAEEQAAAGVARLNEGERAALAQWALRVFGLGQHVTGVITAIKYEGHVVVLDDGSRWEVEDLDTDTADMWLEGDRVVVIDGEMFKLDDMERVSVQRE